MLEIGNIATEMKNVSHRFISRLDRVRKKIFELEDISTETPKTEKQREKRLKKIKI